MWHIAHQLARPIEALLGLFFVVTGIVLYPSEDGVIQSKLEDVWVRIDDVQQVALSRQARFLQSVATIETDWLDRLFGHKLFSFRSFASSACFSAASVTFVIIFPDTSNQFSLWFFLIGFGTAVVCLALVVVPALFPQWRFRKYLDFPIAIIAACALVVVLAAAGFGVDKVGTIIALIAASFVSDYLFIAVTRRLLRMIKSMKNYVVVVFIIVVNLACAWCLVVIPLDWGEGHLLDDGFIYEKLASPVIAFSFLNYADAALALLFAVLCALLLIHRLFWPLLNRTLFKMQDIGTKGRRSILVTVGIWFLKQSVFGGEFPKFMEKILEKVSG